jgi:hypothetical protein
MAVAERPLATYSNTKSVRPSTIRCTITSFLLRENPLLTGSNDYHLALHRIEFENHERVDLEFVLCDRFDRYGRLPGRLEEKRLAISLIVTFAGARGTA